MYDNLDRPPLHAETLRRALVRPGAVWTDVQVVAETESTNADVAAAARSGVAEGAVVVAELQVGGKGRQGRTWVSPRQAGLTFSVLLRPAEVPAERWPWLPLLTGLAVGGVVTRLGEVDALLKWPNDVLVGPGRRKAAGLLAEVVDTAAGPAVVVGVGLNVSTSPDELAVTDATSLAAEGATCVDRPPLLIAILRDLAAAYRTWRDAGGDVQATGQRDAYRDVSATLGRRVRVELPGGAELTGEAVDIDVGGRLVVRDDAGQRVPVAAGDVVHAR